MMVFEGAVRYVRTYLNMVDFQVHGRYVLELFEDALGRPVRIEIFDLVPQVIYRPEGAIYREIVNGEV
jgi:hypothetical protein